MDAVSDIVRFSGAAVGAMEANPTGSAIMMLALIGGFLIAALLSGAMRARELWLERSLHEIGANVETASMTEDTELSSVREASQYKKLQLLEHAVEKKRKLATLAVGAFGVIAAVIAITFIIHLFGDELLNLSYITDQIQLVNVALAQGKSPTEGFSVAEGLRLLPIIVLGIFTIIFLTFVIALGIVVVTPDLDENKRKLDMADSMIKTISGFFIGSATSFMNQALGVT